ncbi:hypothetical protein [Streptomyces dangxiongensis]|nr:hypothetical protein [Streptomyces dangxiongensis]
MPAVVAVSGVIAGGTVGTRERCAHRDRGRIVGDAPGLPLGRGG